MQIVAADFPCFLDCLAFLVLYNLCDLLLTDFRQVLPPLLQLIHALLLLLLQLPSLHLDAQALLSDILQFFLLGHTLSFVLVVGGAHGVEDLLVDLPVAALDAVLGEGTEYLIEVGLIDDPD